MLYAVHFSLLAGNPVFVSYLTLVSSPEGPTKVISAIGHSPIPVAPTCKAVLSLLSEDDAACEGAAADGAAADEGADFGFFGAI